MNAPPWRITFDTNPDDCNLKCVMCEEHSPHSHRQSERIACGHNARRMNIQVLEQVLDELKDSPPSELIPSTMGEPLLYEHFDRILELCQSYKIRLNLTTNGTFPRRGARAWAASILPIASDVKISFNGITTEIQESVMRNSHLATVLGNIRIFIAMRDDLAQSGGNYCSITLQLTFLEQNLVEIPEIIRLAATLNVDRVKGHHLWVHFPEMRDQDLRRSPDSVARWNKTVAECHSIVAHNPRPNGVAVKLEHFIPLQFNQQQNVAVESECPFLGREAWINHAGRFDPCCAPDGLRKTLGSFGEVQQTGFLSIWNGGQYGKLVTEYKNQDLCKNCLMRKPKG